MNINNIIIESVKAATLKTATGQILNLDRINVEFNLYNDMDDEIIIEVYGITEGLSELQNTMVPINEINFSTSFYDTQTGRIYKGDIIFTGTMIIDTLFIPIKAGEVTLVTLSVKAKNRSIQAIIYDHEKNKEKTSSMGKYLNFLNSKKGRMVTL